MAGTNRDKRNDRVRKKHWCWGCDRALVSHGSRCAVCGKTDNSKTGNKKPGPEVGDND